MADKYLSHLGSNTPPYETPATAATTLNGLLGGTTIAAGERIWVKDDHVETYSTAPTFAAPSSATASLPQQIYCVQDFDESPGSLVTAPSGRIATSGAYSITFTGSWRFHGLIIAPGNGTNVNANLLLENTSLIAENVLVDISNHSSSIFGIGFAGNATNTSTIILNGIQYRPRNSSARISLGKAVAFINNLRFASGSTAPSSIFGARGGNSTFSAFVVNSDFSGVAYSSLFSTANPCDGFINFVRCKLRAGTNVFSALALKSPVIRLLDCDSGDTNTRYELHWYTGSIVTSTTVYPTSDPATDGQTNYSHLAASNANTSRHLPLYTDWVERWADGGVAITPYVEVLLGTDGGTPLNNAECWIEVMYQSESGSPLGTMVTSAPAQIIDSGTTLPSGGTSWQGHGFSNPVTHKVSLPNSITPNKSGFVKLRVASARPNASLYIDPQIRW